MVINCITLYQIHGGCRIVFVLCGSHCAMTSMGVLLSRFSPSMPHMMLVELIASSFGKWVKGGASPPPTGPCAAGGFQTKFFLALFTSFVLSRFFLGSLFDLWLGPPRVWFFVVLPSGGAPCCAGCTCSTDQPASSNYNENVQATPCQSSYLHRSEIWVTPTPSLSPGPAPSFSNAKVALLYMHRGCFWCPICAVACDWQLRLGLRV